VSGPLPPPAVLQGYENIKAGYADRIIGWAEEQGKHRRKWESREQWMGYGLDFLGMLLSFGFGAAALWFGVSLIREGHSTAGYVALVGALVPFVVAFLNRPKK
jgi:uncharacterized membrane protein